MTKKVYRVGIFYWIIYLAGYGQVLFLYVLRITVMIHGL
jgi:hypothetical protein